MKMQFTSLRMVKVAVKEITATDNWQASFTDLPVYKEGKKIAYTIAQKDPVTGIQAILMVSR